MLSGLSGLSGLSAVCGAATAAPNLILFIGESNSGGYGLLSDLSAGEKSARPSVQIYNPTADAFQDLHIGTNNLISHAGLTDTATVGWECGLADAVEASRFAASSIHLLKCGQGGSIISEWAAGHGSGYWSTFLSRWAAAVALFPSAVPVVWLSQGINDAIGYSTYLGGAVPGGPTDPDAWATDMAAFHVRLRAVLGASTRICMTKFESPLDSHAAFNTRMDTMALSDPLLTVVSSSGAAIRDGNHWSVAGLKLMAERLIDAALAPFGSATTPTILPASGEYLTDQTVSITAAGNAYIRYVTGGAADPLTGTTYTGTFTVTPPDTVQAVAVQSGRRSSAASVTYTGGTTWSTTDATAGSFTLSNGNRDVVAGQSAWKTVRTTTGRSGGKLYLETVAVVDCAFAMLGFASAGFSPSGYLGTSNYSVGLVVGNSQYLSSGFAAGTGVGLDGYLAAGSVWQLAIDFTAGKIWVGKNNSWYGSGDPAAGTNAAVTFTPGTVGTLYAAASQYGVVEGGKIRVCAASAQQTYSPPSGFTAWG